MRYLSLFFIIFQLVFPCSGFTEDFQEGRPVYTETSIITELYQLMKDTHEIFEKHGIGYWAEGGTLIGAIRHKGIIPWDDDLDISLIPGHEKLLLSAPVQEEFQKAGYSIIDFRNGSYRIIKTNQEFPFIDISKMMERDNKYYYALEGFGKTEGYLLKSEVHPIKKVQFGSFQIHTPARPMELLYDYYGEDFMDMGYWTLTHHNPNFSRVKFKLTEEDRKPAQPIGPLEDRISRELDRPIYTEKEIIAPLYQMIKDTHEIFEKHNITYWADGGTLIGAVRHKGIIPWDDDADFCLEDGHEKILFSQPVLEEFRNAGYQVNDHRNDTYRIVRIGNPFPFIDLFRMTKQNGKYYYTLAVWGQRKGEPMYISEDEVMPLRKGPFGSFQIFVPARATEFLYDYFGKDVMDIGYWSHVHHAVEGFKKIKFNLTSDDRKPAQPIGPLQDRIPQGINALDQ